MFRNELIDFRDKRHELLNKNKDYQGYTAGQIVYLYFPGNSILQTNNKKISCQFVGPLVIWKSFSPTQFVLMSLDGIVYPFLVEETRLKPGFISTTSGPAKSLAELKRFVRNGYIITDSNPSFQAMDSGTECDNDLNTQCSILIYSPDVLLHLDHSLELTPIESY